MHHLKTLYLIPLKWKRFSMTIEAILSSLRKHWPYPASSYLSMRLRSISTLGSFDRVISVTFSSSFHASMSFCGTESYKR